MRIGLMTGAQAGGPSIEQQVQAVADAERDGFESVWFGQIFGGDAMTVIALAGPRTSGIELGTSVVPTYLRHPYAMAQQSLTVQAATGGRFVLGLGLSHKPVIEDMWGLSYDAPARHMREYLSVLLPLVREGRAQFSGEMFRTNATVQVPDSADMPVMIAALAPRMLRIAGEMTDGTITWMTGVKTLETHVVPSLTRAAEAAGRPKPRVAVGLPVALAKDPAAAREHASKLFAIYGTLPNYRRMLDREGVDRPGEVAIVGDEAEVERSLRDLASAGATDFFAPIFPAPGEDAAASMQRTREFVRSLVGKI